MGTIAKKRIYYFDLLKIISVLIVFLYHIYMDMYVIHPMHNLKTLESILIRPNLNLGMFACGIFIFISGATLKLNERDESVLHFYTRRLVRILIPFYITYIIYFFIRAITFRNIHLFGGIPKWRFIFTLMGIDEYLNAAGISTFSLGIGEWFLGCIILCYLAYPLLSYLNKKNYVITFLFMTAFYFYININYDRYFTVMPSYFNFLSQVYNFYLGILFVELKKDKKIVISDKMKVGLIICNLSVLLYLYFSKKYLMIPDNFKTTVAIIVTYGLFSYLERYIERFDLFTKNIDRFNKIAFEFFLVHHFVIYQVDYILGYRRVNGVTTLFIVLIDLVIIFILAVIIERMSYFITNLMYKRHNK